MSAWDKWRQFVKGILDQGRPMTKAERAHAVELVKQAKEEERREIRKARRRARKEAWHE